MSKSRYDLLIQKSVILLNEALKDREIGCYNKSVSALWFSIENIIKAILLKNRGSYPSRVGSLINLIAREIKKLGGNKIAIRYMRELYNDRRDADHSTMIIDENRCEMDLKKAITILNTLRELFKLDITFPL